MSNLLQYKGFKESKNHFELIWLYLEREDFISKMVRIFVSKKTEYPVGIRLSDTDIGSVFIHLKSKRTYAHRWETEDEAKGTSGITKHFTASFAKHVTGKSAKAKLITRLQVILLPHIPQDDSDAIRLVKALNDLGSVKNTKINNLKQYLLNPFVKPQATVPVIPKSKPAPKPEVKVFELKRSTGERIFNIFLKVILAMVLALLGMIIYMQFAR